MSNRLEVSQKITHRPFGFFRLILFLCLCLEALISGSAWGQVNIVPHVSYRDSTITLTLEKQDSKYGVVFWLYSPMDGKDHECKIEWQKPIDVDILTNLEYVRNFQKLSYQDHPDWIGFQFNFSKRINLQASIKNRFMAIDSISITLTPITGSKTQKIALKPELSPPPPTLSLEVKPDHFDFPLEPKKQRASPNSEFTLSLDKADKLADDEVVAVTITADKNSGIQFTSDNQSTPSIRKKFSNQAASHKVSFIFNAISDSGAAQIKIEANQLYPPLTKPIRVAWSTKKEPEWKKWLLWTGAGLSLLGIFFLLAKLIQTKREDRAVSQGEVYQEKKAIPADPVLSYDTDPYYNSFVIEHRSGMFKRLKEFLRLGEPALELNINPEVLVFEKPKSGEAPRSCPFEITGRASKELVVRIIIGAGLSIKDRKDNKITGAVRLSNRPREYFETLFFVSLTNSNNFSREINLEFYVDGKRKVVRQIRIDLPETVEPPAKPSIQPGKREIDTTREFNDLKARVTDLEQEKERWVTISEFQSKLDALFQQKLVDAVLKSSAVNDAIRKQVNAAVGREVSEQLKRRETSASERVSSTRLDLDGGDRLASYTKEFQSEVQDEVTPSQLPAFDLKIQSVITALKKVDGQLNHGWEDELIMQAVQLFSELCTPPAASGGNTGAGSSSGLAAKVAEMKKRNASGPPKEVSVVDRESRFDGLVKGQILPIIVKFDKQPEAPTMPVELQSLAAASELQEIKAGRTEVLNGTYHAVLDSTAGPADRIMKVVKRGFLYKNEVAQKAEVIVGDGRL